MKCAGCGKEMTRDDEHEEALDCVSWLKKEVVRLTADVAHRDSLIRTLERALDRGASRGGT